MSQIFLEDKIVPVTFIEAGPCFVTQIKTKEKDGYQAVQIGFEKKKSKKVKKTEKGKEFKYLRELSVPNSQFPIPELKVGDEVKVEIFKSGEKVRISGISKGKGFAGVVKRHHFKGSPATHGHKDQLRMPGSIGATAPQRVLKGKRMAGRMGGKKVTIQNLEVMEIYPEKNLLIVKGAVPGRRGSLLEIIQK